MWKLKVAEKQMNNLKRSKALYKDVSSLLDEVVTTCDNIFYEILVVPREPVSDQTQRFIIDYQSIEDNISNQEEEKIRLRNSEHPIQACLTYIEDLQNKYELLSKKAFQQFMELGEKLNENHFEVSILKRRVKPQLNLESKLEEESDSESELETESEVQSDSEFECKRDQQSNLKMDFNWDEEYFARNSNLNVCNRKRKFINSSEDEFEEKTSCKHVCNDW